MVARMDAQHIGQNVGVTFTATDSLMESRMTYGSPTSVLSKSNSSSGQHAFVVLGGVIVVLVCSLQARQRLRNGSRSSAECLPNSSQRIMQARSSSRTIHRLLSPKRPTHQMRGQQKREESEH